METGCFGCELRASRGSCFETLSLSLGNAVDPERSWRRRSGTGSGSYGKHSARERGTWAQTEKGQSPRTLMSVPGSMGHLHAQAVRGTGPFQREVRSLILDRLCPRRGAVLTRIPAAKHRWV